MATLTSRLKLTKPDLLDPVQIQVLNTNFQRIDDSFGGRVVTSTTRPGADEVYSGMLIYETDTQLFAVYTGSAWKYVYQPPEDTGWQTQALLTGWTAVSGYAVQLRRIGNRVSLRGSAQWSSGTLQNNIINVPSSMRPTANKWLQAANTSNGMTVTPLLTTSTGNINIPSGYHSGTSATNMVVPLNGEWTTD